VGVSGLLRYPDSSLLTSRLGLGGAWRRGEPKRPPSPRPSPPGEGEARTVPREFSRPLVWHWFMGIRTDVMRRVCNEDVVGELINQSAPQSRTSPMRRPFVSVAIPVYNEARILAESIGKVAAYLQSSFRYPHEIVIADNASTDRTPIIAQELRARYDTVRVLHLDQKGRGRAVQKAW